MVTFGWLCLRQTQHFVIGALALAFKLDVQPHLRFRCTGSTYLCPRCSGLKIFFLDALAVSSSKMNCPFLYPWNSCQIEFHVLSILGLRCYWFEDPNVCLRRNRPCFVWFLAMKFQSGCYLGFSLRGSLRIYEISHSIIDIMLEYLGILWIIF
jgi:hypothetical protein